MIKGKDIVRRHVEERELDLATRGHSDLRARGDYLNGAMRPPAGLRAFFAKDLIPPAKSESLLITVDEDAVIGLISHFETDPRSPEREIGFLVDETATGPGVVVGNERDASGMFAARASSASTGVRLPLACSMPFTTMPGDADRWSMNDPACRAGTRKRSRIGHRRNPAKRYRRNNDRFRSGSAPCCLSTRTCHGAMHVARIPVPVTCRRGGPDDWSPVEKHAGRHRLGCEHQTALARFTINRAPSVVP